jgi:chorismate-pyruvate lyase
VSEGLELLFPLDRFYQAAGWPIPDVRPIPGEEMPEPYRGLLVHSRDMTPTLEAYHGERIHLHTMERREESETFCRLVVLTTDESEKPVEFGAIAIQLELFPPEAQDLIRGCRCPLGAILADYEIPHASSPRAYFEVTPDPQMREVLASNGAQRLYGRRNVLSTPDGRVIADVLEILPA